MDEVRDVNLRDRTEEVEFDSFLPGSVVEIEGAHIEPTEKAPRTQNV